MYWMYPCLASSSRNPAGFLISIFSKTIKSVHETHRVIDRVPATNHTPPSTTFRRAATCLTVSVKHLTRGRARSLVGLARATAPQHALSPKHRSRSAASDADEDDGLRNAREHRRTPRGRSRIRAGESERPFANGATRDRRSQV